MNKINLDDIKTLYIVRHAKSSWKDSELSDEQRPLNKRGKRDAPFMADLIANKVESKNRALLSSTAVRAFTTAKVFAKALGIKEKDIIQSDELYLADEDEILGEVKTFIDDYDTLFIFGHNPGFTYFANRVCDTDIANVPTTGVVCVTFNVDKWKDIGFGKGKLEYFEYPKKYLKESSDN